MKLSKESIKEFITAMGYRHKDGVNDEFEKKYNGYVIVIDFENSKIKYGEKIRVGDLTTSNFENSENFVVLECIDRLLTKGYLPEDLALEYKFPLGRNEKGKLDILVLKNKKAFIMIECKTWGLEYQKEQKKMMNNGGQLFSYYVQDKATEYLCLYTSRLNNNNIEYHNSIVKVDEKWRELSNQKEIFEYWNKNFFDNGIFENWVNAYDFENKSLRRGQLKELTQDDSGRIFNQFAEILRHNAVSDKPNAFNKILNLFICKIIDENKLDDEEVDFQWKDDDTDEKLQARLNDLYKKGMLKFLEIEVTDYNQKELKEKLINIHEENIKAEIEQMFEKLRLQKNPEFAFKEVYNEQSFTLNSIVVKEIVELLQPYQFRYGHKQQFLGDFFELLLNTSIKQEAGQFFTPVPITRFIVSSIPIKEIMKKKILNEEKNILPVTIDYATGSGHFLTEFMDKLQSIIAMFDTSHIRRDAAEKINLWKQGEFNWANECVYGIEADYRLVKTTKVSSFLNGDGEANIIRADGLDNFQFSKDYKGILKNNGGQDNKVFDLVIANPPYSVSSFKNTLNHGEESFTLFKYLTDDSSEIECLFVERTKQLLKSGGYAGIILPNSILTNSSIYIPTRELILKYFNICSIVEFGQNTFMATGTNTVTLFLEKREDTDYKVVEYAVDNFIKYPNDFSINNIENVVTKYVIDTYPSIELNDYLLIFEKKLNDKIIKSDFYINYKVYIEGQKEYQKMIKSSSFNSMKIDLQDETKNKFIIEKIIDCEKEKLFYFILTCNQKTTIIKTGQKQDEKDFLGYEFSNRRGSEGIKIYRDSEGNHITSLYDEKDENNIYKANYYVRNSLLHNDVGIEKSLSNNIVIVKLTDLMDFSKPYFDKSISLNIKKKIKFNSNLPKEKLSNLIDTLETGDRPKGGVNKYKSGIISIGGEHIGKDGNLNLKNIKYVPLEFYNKTLTGRVVDNDILICKDGALSGKVCFIPSNIKEKMLVNEHVYILRTNDKINQKFLFYLLASKEGQKILQANVTGAGAGGINQTNLKEIEIPLPSIEKQNRICDYIDSIITSNNLYKQEIYKCDSYKNNIIDNLFENNNYKKLDELCEFITDGTHKTPDYTKTGIPFLSATNVISEKIDWKNLKYISQDLHNKLSKRVKPKKNDILLSKNGTIGYAAIVDKDIDFDVYVSLAVLRPKEDIMTEYIWMLLNSDKIRNEFISRIIGMGVPNLHLNKIRDVKIPIINLIDQKEIVKKVMEIEEKKLALIKKIDSNNDKIDNYVTKSLIE